MCRYAASPLWGRDGTRHITVPKPGLIPNPCAPPFEKCWSEFSSSSFFPSRSTQRSMQARTVPRASDADWSSVGMLPPADADRDARFLVFTGRTGRWKGIFAVHSWVVFKPENASSWSRYDVVGWGQPLRTNGWAPDGRWFGDTPRVLVDVRGPAAAALIPKVKATIAAYGYSH